MSRFGEWAFLGIVTLAVACGGTPSTTNGGGAGGGSAGGGSAGGGSGGGSASVSTAVAISSHASHTCVTTSDGLARCWGDGQFYQLGNGSMLDESAPYTVPQLYSGGLVTRAAAGGNFTCLIRNPATAIGCFGDDSYYQSGAAGVPSNELVLNIDAGVVEVATGGFFACARLANNSVRCWGRSDAMQTGLMQNKVGFASEVTGLDAGVKQLVAQGASACALMNDNGVRCWGDNTNGRLGSFTTGLQPSGTPLRVTNLDGGAKQIAGGADFACALMDWGAVKCWGSNAVNQLGTNGQALNYGGSDIVGVSGAKAIAAGGQTACAITSGDNLQCWGGNQGGKLGDAGVASSAVPVTIPGLFGVAQAAIGSSHICALLVDAGIRCWGSNLNGELGNGTKTASVAPTTVVGY